jgi:replicative DNA helicase
MVASTVAFKPRAQSGDRPVPADVAAERNVLGALILDRDAVIRVAPILEPADFWDERNARLYEAILALYQRLEPPDLGTIESELRRRGWLETVPVSYFIGLMRRVPTSLHVEHYARSVERAAACRRLIAAGGRIVALGYEEGSDLDALLAEAEGEIIGARPRDRSHQTTMAAAMDSVLGALEGAAPERAITTGFETLDLLTARWHPGDLVIVAARPSNGKSALAQHFALAAAHNNFAVQFFSLEMSAEALATRALASTAGIDMQRLRAQMATAEPLLDERELSRLMNARGTAGAAAARIHIDPSGGQSINAVRAAMRLARHRHGVELVIIDYLQLVEGIRKSKSDSQNNEIGSITRGLKLEAEALGVTVICLSQMSRAVEHRANRRPQLSDLRDSGNIEQDADMVLFIHRPELYDPRAEKGRAELIIAKQRNGPLGDVPLRWRPEFTRYEEAQV